MADALRFGTIDIRVSERRLMVDGRPVTLGARAFDVLVALAERRDRVVTRHELLDLVWPGLVVEEANLAVQVSALRKALGPHAIATIPGRGYRFTLTLSAPEGVPAELPPPPPAPQPSSAPSFSAFAAAAAAPARLLPVASTPLLGRDDDLAALAQVLQTHRLVTVVGAGGIGKTSLALAAVHRLDDAWRERVAWVELAPISDVALLPGAVAQALRVPVAGHADPVAGLVSSLRSQEALLVLDNAEHLIDGVARLAEALLSGAPGVRLLVTSQAALKVEGERLLRLGPLTVPKPGASVPEALACGAVALFVDQARAADQRFQLDAGNVETVVALCRQLDGVALALKLAAARLPFLGLKGLQSRLSERLKLLGGGHRNAPTRQQTLMAALEWSHSLLNEAEQRVFRRLAVFAGGFSLELACAVASDDPAAPCEGSLDEAGVVDLLSSLVDRSLVAVDGGDPPRYRLLESAREYAWIRLGASGEMAALKDRHARVMTALFERADGELWYSQDDPWLATYTPELDNARAAMDWSVQHENPMAVSLIASLVRLLFQLPLSHETRRRSDAVLPLVDKVECPSVRARYWVRRSHGTWGVDHGLALAYAQRAADLYRGLDEPLGLHEALFAMATSWRLPSDEMAEVLAEMRQLERPDWPPRVRADRHVAQVVAYYKDGAFEDMFREARQGMRASMDAGSRLRVNILQWYACTALRAQGRVDEAVDMGREALGGLGRWRGWSLGFLLGEYVWACVLKGAMDDAMPALNEFFALSRTTGWTAFRYHSHLYTRVALAQGRHEDAARLLGFAEQSWQRIGAPFPDMVRERAYLTQALLGHLDQAALDRLRAEGSKLAEDQVCDLISPGDGMVVPLGRTGT